MRTGALALLLAACGVPYVPDKGDTAVSSGTGPTDPGPGDSGGHTHDTEDTRVTDTVPGDSADTDNTAPIALTYPDQRVGMFYLTWHAYAADAAAKAPASAPRTVEDVIRDPALPFSSMILDAGLYNEAAAFHWHQEPELGFYCLYRPRDGEDPYPEPDAIDACETADDVARAHAATLWDAGVDFVYVDLTNLPTYSAFADVLGLRPLEVLLEVWGQQRRDGLPTPQIAAWLPLTATADEPLFRRVLDAYDTAEPDLVFTADDGRPVLFVVGSATPDPGYVAEIEARGAMTVPLWGNLGADTLAAGTAGWMQPCTSGGSFTTLVSPSTPCEQGYTTTSPLGTVLSVSRSYQVGYASLPYQASGRLEGLTLQKQFETAFAVQPDVLLINAWNEHIAQPQSNPYDAGLGGLRRSMGVTEVPDGDDSADWLWVDMYGAELGRDLEPTVQDGGAGLALLQSCLRVWRTGATVCDDASEACCQLAEGRNLVYSARQTGGVTGVDHLPTLSRAELDAVVAGGAFVEVCNPHYGPPGLCGGGTTGDGPFGLYPSGGAGRVAITRCFTGVDHFLSTDPSCEDTTVEGPLGWAATTRSSAMPRPLRRCYDEGARTHLHWLDEHCPDGVREEAILGYVQ